MTRFYYIFACLVCVVFLYANLVGWRMLDFFTTGKWGPRGPNYYHK